MKVIKMAIKLFVTDLDGTLLESAKDVTAENIKAIQLAVDSGVIVTIATGRMYKAALPVAKALGVNVPIITYNGALIKSAAGEVLASDYLDAETVKEVINYCRSKQWYLQLYSHDELYFASYDDYAKGYEQAQAIKGHLVGWDGLKKRTDNVCKLLSITDNADETNARVAELNERFADKLQAMRSNAHYVEIVKSGVSKAAGLKKLAGILGIAIEDTMAIGDGDNDLPMLKAAGHSVAMGNAVPAVKAACEYETGACLDNGLAQAIYHYVLSKNQLKNK